MKRLAEKAGTSKSLMRGFANGAAVLENAASAAGEGSRDAAAVAEDREREIWDGAPFGHAVIGALMLPNCDKTSLGLLCGLHAMAMQE